MPALAASNVRTLRTTGRARLETIRPFTAAMLAEFAVGALIEEACLTPKPALVDRRGSGAHQDLDLGCLLRSAEALRPTFRSMATIAGAPGTRVDQSLREQLARIGRAGEQDMLAATGGSNTHRGAIWVIGLLLSARALDAEATSAEVAIAAAHLAAIEDRYAPQELSHGRTVCERYGVSGARGEARAAFPHVIQIGLPMLGAARARGVSECCAQLDALMAIMSQLSDTCVLHRGGLLALQAAQDGARRVLAVGGTSTLKGREALHHLDRELLRHNASPGGSADLLAACLFLDRSRFRAHAVRTIWR